MRAQRETVAEWQGKCEKTLARRYISQPRSPQGVSSHSHQELVMVRGAGCHHAKPTGMKVFATTAIHGNSHLLSAGPIGHHSVHFITHQSFAFY